MKTQIILAAAVLFLGLNSFKGEKTNNSIPVNSNICLTGTIIDGQTKETLVGVEVSIEGTNLKTYTDFEGNFSFDGIQPGDYKVITKYVSYNTIESRKVTIQSNEMHALNLELQAQSSAPSVEKVDTNSMMATTSQNNTESVVLAGK